MCLAFANTFMISVPQFSGWPEVELNAFWWRYTADIPLHDALSCYRVASLLGKPQICLQDTSREQLKDSVNAVANFGSHWMRHGRSPGAMLSQPCTGTGRCQPLAVPERIEQDIRSRREKNKLVCMADAADAFGQVCHLMLVGSAEKTPNWWFVLYLEGNRWEFTEGSGPSCCNQHILCLFVLANASLVHDTVHGRCPGGQDGHKI
jgi:hypothetical protein